MNPDLRDRMATATQAAREKWSAFEDFAEFAGKRCLKVWDWLAERPLIMRWSIVVLSVAIATLIGLAFRQNITVGSQLLLFLPAVMLSALYGGWITGTSTSLLGACVSLFYYFHIVESQRLDGPTYRQNFVALVLYGIACLIIIGLARAQLYHQQRCKDLADTLEERVKVRTEEMQVAHKELADFCYSISHDFRAPMRNMIGSSRILIEDSISLNGDDIRRLEGMAASAQRLNDLVEALLGHARLLNAHLHQEWIDLTRMGEEVAISVMSKQWSFSRVTFKSEPGLVAGGDPVLVGLVMRCLVENSCKYSKPNEPLLIELGEQYTKGKTWFYIRDNGIGLDMAFESKIFEPLQKLHRDAEVAGTGIGLANVKRIIERHGGTIFVESAPGKGATFYFNLGGLAPDSPRPSSNAVEPKRVILAEEA